MDFGEPWTAGQQQLVNVVISAWARENAWPLFQYVQQEMPEHLDAAGVMATFPILGSLHGGGYCDVIYDRTPPAPREDGQVKLAVSALARHAFGEQAVLMFVAALKTAARRRMSTTYSPTRITDVLVTRDELCAEWRWEPILVGPLRGVLESEWPPGIEAFHGNPAENWSFKVGADARQYIDLTVDGYLELVRQRFTVATNHPTSLLSLNKTQEGAAVDTGNVFIVHGHDEAAKHEVARTIQRLTNRQPIILDEQRSGGDTVIEKFEKYGDSASFAVVLLTPDDTGGKPDGAMMPRARQNVVFELGYFFAKLGRERVVGLTKGVDLPSDIAGVVYISMEDKDWPTRLGREMKHFPDLGVDLNRL